MLRAEHDGDVITIITDDAQAENAVLGEAIDTAAPHLLESFEATAFADGELRWKVERADWPSLSEVLEALLASGDIPDFESIEDAMELVDRARG